MTRAVTVAVLLALSLTASPARAEQGQAPKIEVAAGYAELQNMAVDRSFPAGMFMSVEGNYRPWLGVIGEFSGTFATKPPGFFGDPAAGTGAFLTGPRLVFRRVPRVVAFGQILFGAGRSGDDRDGYRAVGIQPGAGIDVTVHKHIAVRIASDRRYLMGIGPASGATASLGGFRTGLVLR